MTVFVTMKHYNNGFQISKSIQCQQKTKKKTVTLRFFQ